MSIIITTLLIFIWVGVLHYRKNRTNRTEERRSHDFWNKERSANDVRKKDISNLPYIQIPIETLPLEQSTDSELQDIHAAILELSKQKILNLGHLSNTDLKMQYGPSNLDTLTEYDMNFTTLIRTISHWGEYLYSQGQTTEARTVLEYGISCKTDIKNNYTLLAKIYQNNNEADKVTDLIAKAECLNTLMKTSIISSLQAIQNS